MKKILAMLLVATMTLSAFAGCGSKEAASNAEEPAATETETEAEVEVEEEPETIKMVARWEPNEDDEMVVEELNKLLKEKINVQVDIEFVSGGEYDTRTQNIITSGEECDLMYSNWWTNVFSTNVAREAFMPLDELLDTTEVGAVIKEHHPQWALDSCSVDGTVYGIPCYNDNFFQLYLFIQKDLADEYGLDINAIKDFDDIEPFMDWVLETHPEHIPMYEGNLMAGHRRGPYELVSAGFSYFLDFEDPYNVCAFWEHEGNIEGWREANDWFHKGYIRSDWATATDTSADYRSNKYACWINQSSVSGEAEALANFGEAYYGIPMDQAYTKGTAGQDSMWVINANSTKGEAALKVISMLLTDVEVVNLLTYGIEGEHYTKTGENTIEQIPDSGYNRVGEKWCIGNERLSYLTPDMSADLLEQQKAIFDRAVQSPLMGFTFDYANVENEVAQINAVTGEWATALLTAEDFEATLEEVKAALKDAGEDTVKAEIARQLEEYKANK